MIQLDGKSGGGQILRSALSLSMITGEPFHLKNIRGKRPKPGLMRQHLTCVQAAAEICGAATDGAELKSTELIFHPGEITAGDYHFKIGTAGSTTLLAQTLLPALWMASSESSLRLEGGTHNPMAPTYDYIDRIFLAATSCLGFHADSSLIRHGFAPAGGGEIIFTTQPATERKAHDWLERGKLINQSVHSTIAHIPEEVANRENNTAIASLNWPLDTNSIITNAEESQGSGNTFAVELVFENVAERITTFGATNRSAEAVAKEAAKKICDYTGSRAVVGRQLADQLLLPMALAEGGSFITMEPSNHTRTNIFVIEQFLDVQFTISQTEETQTLISIQ